MLFFLFIATLLPTASLVGKFGHFLGDANFLLFGYLSYVVCAYLSYMTYLFYKQKLNRQNAERLFILFVLLLNLLFIQALMLNKGVIGTGFVDSLMPVIGLAGVILMIGVIFSWVSFLFFEEGMKAFFEKLFPKKEPKLEEKVEEKKKIDEEVLEEEISKEELVNRYIEEQIHHLEHHLDLPSEEETNQLEEKDEAVEVREEKVQQSEFIEVDKREEESDNKVFSENEENEQELIEQESIVDEKPTLEESEKVENIYVEKIDEEINVEKEEILQEIKKIEKEKKEETKVNVILSELEENKELLKDLEIGQSEKPKDFVLPPFSFLSPPQVKKREVDENEIDEKIDLLINKLVQFKIEGDVVRTYTGPIVTTFEFKPLPHIKVSKILNLQDDLAMALKAQTIRIQAPVPGKDVVGIEIPNKNLETIYLREILESDLYQKSKSPLTIVLGKDIVGNAFITDLKKLPHLLIAGTTGSGKSVGINAMILSLLYKNSPDNLKLMMIDPKMLEFSIYNDIPHLLTPVITEPKKAIVALNNMVKEMERRYRLMSEARVKNIENYNEESGDKLPYIVVVIDELADLMMTSGKDVEYSIARLAQMARASGIHLIVATQRPSVDVVTGLIKANLPSRISFKVGQKIDSKVILDQLGAESLLGRGDMLFTPPGVSGLVRLHAPYTSEKEIDKIVEFLKEQKNVEYDHYFLDESLSEGSEEEMLENKDDLYDEAKEIILNEKKTSISYLQRRLQIGYNRAANIIEQMESTGVLSAPNAKGQREILL